MVIVSFVFSSGIFLAVWLARKNYEAELRQQIWNGTAPRITALAQPAQEKIPTLLLLGDSRMAQWGLPDIGGWRVVNGALGGLTTGQIAAVTPNLLDEFQPQTVVVEVGINDLKFIGLRPDLAAETISLAISNLTRVVADCERRHCPIVILKTWPAGTPSLARRLVWNRHVAAAVEEFNQRLEKLNVPARGGWVVDLWGNSGLKPEARDYTDTLHFRPDFYERLTPVLAKQLAAIRLDNRP